MANHVVPYDAFRIIHLQSMNPEARACIEAGILGTFGIDSFASVFTKVEKSLYYKTLETGDYDLYDRFIQSVGQYEHSSAEYKRLTDSFDVKKIDLIEVKKFVGNPNLFVQAGNHRLSILKFKNLLPSGIPFNRLSIKYCEYTKREIGEALQSTVGDSIIKGWNNSRAPYGYHSFTMSNIQFNGQRNPAMRLEKIRKAVLLENKKVLDLGCNTGGMLLHAPEIAKGYGIDLDPKTIAAATLIRSKLYLPGSYTFEVGDIDAFDIESFCKTHFYPDVVFLLSLGSWLTQWRKVFSECYSKVHEIVFETNNDEEGAPQLLHFLELGADIKLISNASDDDCTGNMKRKTFLITNKANARATP